MAFSYQNPILRGMYPDPSIVRVEDTFYLVNSTFEYYPGIALSKSTDLLNWTKLPSIVTEVSQADLRSSKSNEGIFAVCIRYHDGHFYVITTNFAEFKNFIIRGTLSDDGRHIIWEQNRVVVDIFGIDPDLFFENGKAYVQFTGYIDDKGTKAIQQVEIDITSGTILKGPKVLSLGTGGRDVEGPHIIKRNDWYYLLAAEGGTGLGHMITMFRSKSLWGPYEEAPQNPLFTNRDRADEPLQNIGHADLFQDASGNWWLTCLGTRPTAIDHIQITNIGRETLLYPVDWSTEWPSIYNGTPTLTVDLTDFPEHAKTLKNQDLTDFVDDFSEDKLHPEWVSLRDSLTARLSLTNGTLILSGSSLTLSNVGTPSFLALRQTEHQEIFTLDIDTKETKINNGAIGIAVTINTDHYGALLIEKGDTEGTYHIFKVAKVLDLEIKERIATIEQLPRQLVLEHGKDYKRFSAVLDHKTITFDLHAQHFSNEAIAALNTGDFQGMYVLDDAKLVVVHASRKVLLDNER
ncbi:glycoside hydrolase family 43 protein [Streptococcus sp. S784/96/1]|uniref:glycoside hydrolase family 43 protein n=1 Tax=Streptococcus sp. S784/96/1 TaxID=2653499 RepID=UPI001386E2AA|nr:glycoside hydrolase family 43 protein [Streptococcus sp. S784/96/1]